MFKVEDSIQNDVIYGLFHIMTIIPHIVYLQLASVNRIVSQFASEHRIKVSPDANESIQQ